ncbi:MAG: hypothetical protein ACYSWQ_17725 [Planctomycetota bacterium]|jgi:hypothetical protein
MVQIIVVKLAGNTLRLPGGRVEDDAVRPGAVIGRWNQDRHKAGTRFSATLLLI